MNIKTVRLKSGERLDEKKPNNKLVKKWGSMIKIFIEKSSKKF